MLQCVNQNVYSLLSAYSTRIISSYTLPPEDLHTEISVDLLFVGSFRQYFWIILSGFIACSGLQPQLSASLRGTRARIISHMVAFDCTRGCILRNISIGQESKLLAIVALLPCKTLVVELFGNRFILERQLTFGNSVVWNGVDLVLPTGTVRNSSESYKLTSPNISTTNPIW